MRYDWVIQVQDPVTLEWNEVYYDKLSQVDALDWGTKPTLTFEVDNQQGANWAKCYNGPAVRAWRNGVLAFEGEIQEPEGENSGGECSLNVSALDKYRASLSGKLTNASCWNFKNIDPRDVLLAAIGRRFVVQEYFNNQLFIDPLTMDNVTLSEKTMRLTVATSGLYEASGSWESALLRNSDWSTMGNINTINLTISGTLAHSNVILNNGFEDDFNHWTQVKPNTESFTIDTQTVFSGTKSARIVCNTGEYRSVYGLTTSDQYAAGPGQLWAIAAYVMGDCPQAKLHIKAYSANHVFIDDVVISEDLSLTQDSFSMFSYTGTTPAGTAYVQGMIEFYAAGTSHVDSISMVNCSSIKASASRNGGMTWEDAVMSYDNVNMIGNVTSFSENLIVRYGNADPTFNSSAGWTMMGGNESIANGVVSLQATATNPSGVQCTFNNLLQDRYITVTVQARKVGTITQPLVIDLYAPGYDDAAQQVQVDPGQLTNDYQSFTLPSFTIGACPASVNLRLFTLEQSGQILVDSIAVVPQDKNLLKYKITLYSNEAHITSASASQVYVSCDTDSDTGVMEGTIDAWVNPIGGSNTITYDFSDSYRDDVIDGVIKLTGQDAYIQDGLLHVRNQRGNPSSTKVFAVGTNLKSLSRKRSKTQMANAITLIGSGVVNEYSTFTDRYSIKDDASIAAYGRREAVFNEKDLNDMGMVELRCNLLLQRYKNPPETLSGKLFDDQVQSWAIGDIVSVQDPSNSTGVTNYTFNPDWGPGKLRISKMTRSYGMDGEDVELEFTNFVSTVDSGFKSILSAVNKFTNKEQPMSLPTPASVTDQIDKYHPAMLPLYIQTDKADKVQDILLSVYTRPFRATNTLVVVQSGTPHSHDVLDHQHEYDLPLHYHEQEYWDNASTDSGGNLESYSTGGTDLPTHTHWLPAHQHTLTPRINSDGYHFFITKVGNHVFTDGNTLGVTSSTDKDGGHTTTSDTSHTHNTQIVYGIFDYNVGGNAKLAPCQVYMNEMNTSMMVRQFGTMGDEDNPVQVSLLSLLPNYDANYNKPLHPGMNRLFVKAIPTTNNPNGLLGVTFDCRVIYKG